jgi:cyclophilin family peptidyl-prolyl cis-trans isomerase
MKNIIFALAITLVILGCQSSETVKEETEKQILNQKDKTTMNTEQTVAVVNTSYGTIEIELYEDKTPKTVENFVGLAKQGYYNGVIIHRVIADFMIQGGDPTGTGRGGASLWGSSFEDEIVADLKHDEPGILSMANSGPNSNGSQFFITVVPTPWLDGKHTIFGKVINGMNVVYDISKVKTAEGDRPINDVVMLEVEIETRAGEE